MAEIIVRMVLDVMALVEMTVIAIIGLGAATVVAGIIVAMVPSMTGCGRTPGPDRLRICGFLFILLLAVLAAGVSACLTWAARRPLGSIGTEVSGSAGARRGSRGVWPPRGPSPRARLGRAAGACPGRGAG